MESNKPFRGIFTIPSTPFRDDGEIDVPSFRRVVDFCVDCGAHGLVFPVNASEFTALSDTERFLLSEVLVEQNAGRVPAIIGVAGVSSEVAATFARHAHDIGIEGHDRFSVSTAIRIGKELEGLRPMWFETPVMSTDVAGERRER